MIPINTNATTVRVYAGVPLTFGGEDKFYFNSKQALIEALSVYQVWEGANFSYQRIKYSVPEGKASYTIILPTSVLSLNNGCVNYLSINQDGFTTFCFITDCEMEGSDSCHIEYTPDYFTTFINLVSLSGYVEREHSATDKIGDNVIPEPINISKFIEVHQDSLPDPLPAIDPKLVLLNGGISGLLLASEPTSLIATIIPVEGMKSKGFFGGEAISMQYYWSAIPGDFADQVALVNNAWGADGVYGVYALDFAIPDANSAKPYTAVSAPTIILNSYSEGIKNKKLLTSQFYYLSLWSRDGDQVTIKPECLKTGFTINAVSTAGPGAVTTWTVQNTTQYPFGSVAVTAKRAYPLLWSKNDSANTVLRATAGGFINFGQQLVNSAIDIFGSSVQTNLTGKGNMATPALKGATGAVKSYTNIGFDMLRAWNQTASQMGGSISAGYCKLILPLGGLSYFGLPDDIKTAIDSYFSAYGYQTNTVKSVSLNSRPSWNYIKMGDAVIKGIMPDMARETILAYFKSGVRLWHVSDIGNYSLANEV